jgi:hypothetical protein
MLGNVVEPSPGARGGRAGGARLPLVLGGRLARARSAPPQPAHPRAQPLARAGVGTPPLGEGHALGNGAVIDLKIAREPHIRLVSFP